MTDWKSKKHSVIQNMVFKLEIQKYVKLESHLYNYSDFKKYSLIVLNDF